MCRTASIDLQGFVTARKINFKFYKALHFFRNCQEQDGFSGFSARGSVLCDKERECVAVGQWVSFIVT